MRAKDVCVLLQDVLTASWYNRVHNYSLHINIFPKQNIHLDFLMLWLVDDSVSACEWVDCMSATASQLGSGRVTNRMFGLDRLDEMNALADDMFTSGKAKMP